MTVDMLADAIHKNRATVYRYENNEIKSIPLVDLEPLANALGTGSHVSCRHQRRACARRARRE